MPRGTHSALPQYGLAEGEFWQHLVASSLAAEVVQRRSTRSLPLEASTAALLHDIGKLMIGRLVDRESLQYLECARELGEGIEVEMAILDTHHAEVGASSDSIGIYLPGLSAEAPITTRRPRATTSCVTSCMWPIRSRTGER
ncbi:MAG: hypothetical protein CL482_14815 [Acidobacteria bacterium]|nr:hypothetical protein [Acidobacteriota bacterium]